VAGGLHRLHVAAGQRADLAGVDVRVREPGGGGDPRRAHPERAADGADTAGRPGDPGGRRPGRVDRTATPGEDPGTGGGGVYDDLKAAAAARKASLASGSPMETRAPSPANGRTATPSTAQAAAKSIVRSPSRSQTKFASVGGTSQPWEMSVSRTRVRSLTTRSTRSSSSSSAASDAMAATWARWLTANGTIVLRTAAATGSWPIR